MLKLENILFGDQILFYQIRNIIKQNRSEITHMTQTCLTHDHTHDAQNAPYVFRTCPTNEHRAASAHMNVLRTVLLDFGLWVKDFAIFDLNTRFYATRHP